MTRNARQQEMAARFAELSDRDQRRVLAYAAELRHAAREVAAGRAQRAEDVSLDVDWNDGYADLNRRRIATVMSAGCHDLKVVVRVASAPEIVSDVLVRHRDPRVLPSE